MAKLIGEALRKARGNGWSVSPVRGRRPWCRLGRKEPAETPAVREHATGLLRGRLGRMGLEVVWNGSALRCDPREPDHIRFLYVDSQAAARTRDSSGSSLDSSRNRIENFR